MLEEKVAKLVLEIILAGNRFSTVWVCAVPGCFENKKRKGGGEKERGREQEGGREGEGQWKF